MTSTLVRGKYVISKITGPNSAQVFSDGAVFQSDGEIVEVGAYDDLRKRHSPDEVIGSPSYVVMPGLVNDHFHVGLSPFQLGAPDLPLELWMLYQMRAKDRDPYLDQLYGAVLMIKSGTTTVQAIHSPPRTKMPFDLGVAEKVLKAYQDSGMRVSYAPSLVNKDSLVVGPRGGEEEFASQLPAELAGRFKSLFNESYLPAEEVIGRVEEIYMKYSGDPNGRVRITVAPSNVHRCSDDLLVALRQLATKYKTGIHIHLQETIYQKLYGLRAWNKTPLQHLHELDFLGPDVVCGHGVWLTDDDIEIMAATGTNVCHNPSSNLRLRSGIAPVNRFLQKGIRVALGSDEAGLNDDKDMLQEMRLALKIHRVPGEATSPSAHQVFQMATVNGAYSSWFGDRVGTLEPGNRADIILMSLENIENGYLDPDVSIVDAVVHRGRSVDVDTVMVDGDVVMRGRKLTHVDEEGLLKEIKSYMSRRPVQHEIERRDLAEKVEPYLRRFYEGGVDLPMQSYYYYNAKV